MQTGCNSGGALDAADNGHYHTTMTRKSKTKPKQDNVEKPTLTTLHRLCLSALSGVVLALALPTPGWWPLAWVGLVPLFAAIKDLRTWKAFGYGLLMGTIYGLITTRWLTLFGVFLWIGLAVFQGLFWALCAALISRFARLRNRALALALIPIAWVAVDFVRSLGPFGCPWISLAHTQANCLPVIQIAAIAGLWGIDFVVCAVNLALSTLIADRARSKAPLIAAAGLVAVTLAFGVFSLRSTPSGEQGHKVAVLQGNTTGEMNPTPNYLPYAYERYRGMTVDAARAGAELILWPETAIPTNIASPGRADAIAGLAKQLNVCVLAGGYELSEDPSVEGSYNSLIAFDRRGQKTGSYHKVHLVPFGEFLPYREHLTFLKGYGIRDEDVLAADRHELLESSIGKIGTSICFESAFPQISRTEVRDGAEVLAIVSNDAWFKRTCASAQHMMMARLRAVENRRYVLRAASTGISAVVDAYGRIRSQLGVFRQGTLNDEVVPSRRLAIYTRLGDWFAYMCAAVVAVGLLLPREKPQGRRG